MARTHRVPSRPMRTLAVVLLSSVALCGVAACSSSSTSDDMPSPADAEAHDATGSDAAADGAAVTGNDATGRDAAGDATVTPEPDAGDASAAPDADAANATAVTDASLDADATGDATLEAGLVDAGSPSSEAGSDGATATADAGLTCAAAASAKGSLGCDFYAVQPETFTTGQCFAAYVVNASSAPAHLGVEHTPGTPLDPTSFAFIPSGVGASVAYTPYDASAGIAPGQAAVLFLAGEGASGAGSAVCPIASPAFASGTTVAGTGTNDAFHISTDVPVSAYQMGALLSSGIPGSSLLLPTSAWDTNYVVATAGPYDSTTTANPSFNVIAYQDNTQITLLPTAAIVGGGTLPAGAVGAAYAFTLNRGQEAQFSQQGDLSGTILQSSLPVGVVGANACMEVPSGVEFCDHGEQMVPPVKALGSVYAAVMFRPRMTGDTAEWRLVGVVDGTMLTYSTTIAGAPLSLNHGQSATFPSTDIPFTVQSQDSAHPFLLSELMTGGEPSNGYGDPEIVPQVTPAQFGTSATFETDPTFPETNLVVVRAKDSTATFRDVTLDCAGALTGWQSLGAYEWARIDLTRHAFAAQGSCSSGPHTMTSAGPFGATVWGWGSDETTPSTAYTSYGYPAAMGVAPINSVVVSATP
jgi:hypothetical protein